MGDVMARFIISYLGGNPPSNPEEGKRHMAEYKAWLASHQALIVSPANPFKNTHTIASDGAITKGSITAMSGYTLVETATMEEAMAIAQTCPFLATGGSLEVSELVQMSQ